MRILICFASSLVLISVIILYNDDTGVYLRGHGDGKFSEDVTSSGIAYNPQSSSLVSKRRIAMKDGEDVRNMQGNIVDDDWDDYDGSYDDKDDSEKDSVDPLDPFGVNNDLDLYLEEEEKIKDEIENDYNIVDNGTPDDDWDNDLEYDDMDADMDDIEKEPVDPPDPFGFNNFEYDDADADIDDPLGIHFGSNDPFGFNDPKNIVDSNIVEVIYDDIDTHNVNEVDLIETSMPIMIILTITLTMTFMSVMKASVIHR